MSNKRLVSLILVGLIHVALGYAVISGLALKAVKVVAGPLETFEVEEPVEPEEEPPPPPEQLDEIPPYVPPPDIVVQNLPPPPAPVTTVRTPPPPAPPPRVQIPAPPAPPAPPPAPDLSRQAEPRRGSDFGFGQDDYPSASLRNEEEGTVTITYQIGTNGRVVNGSCRVVDSSGHSRLDDQSCRLAERNFRFNPGLNRAGEEAVTSRTDRFRWEIQ
ncbi:energy transducer TonB [Pacificimonas sp. ICDLI1SI03]|jgi:protein TonB|tara:strand:+ start:141705 stop:142352 length:648 start_codon:yes stop_codon:yes gene_type:complete